MIKTILGIVFFPFFILGMLFMGLGVLFMLPCTWLTDTFESFDDVIKTI